MTVHRLPFYIDPSSRQIVQPTKVKVEYGSLTDWNHRLLTSSSGKFDIISEHCYGTTQRFDLDQGKYIDVSPAEPMVDSCRRGANYIKSVRENWELYKKDFPELEQNQIKVSIDEWGFQKASGMKQLFGLAMMLHEMFRASDFITMAAYTMGVSWLSYNKTDSTYSGAGVLFKLYRDRFGVTPVDLTGSSPQPAPNYPPGGDQPSVNAGSPTYPVDTMATLSADGKTLTVATVNATADTQDIELSLNGFDARPNGKLWRLTGTTLDATNRVGQPAQVTVAELAFDARSSVLSAAPYSVEIHTFTRA
jgi:alpha-N-arabinofuranosidase